MPTGNKYVSRDAGGNLSFDEAAIQSLVSERLPKAYKFTDADPRLNPAEIISPASNLGKLINELIVSEETFVANLQVLKQLLLLYRRKASELLGEDEYKAYLKSIEKNISASENTLKEMKLCFENKSVAEVRAHIEQFSQALCANLSLFIESSKFYKALFNVELGGELPQILNRMVTCLDSDLEVGSAELAGGSDRFLLANQSRRLTQKEQEYLAEEKGNSPRIRERRNYLRDRLLQLSMSGNDRALVVYNENLKQGFGQFAITPVQRLAKYPILVRELYGLLLDPTEFTREADLKAVMDKIKAEPAERLSLMSDTQFEGFVKQCCSEVLSENRGWYVNIDKAVAVVNQGMDENLPYEGSRKAALQQRAKATTKRWQENAEGLREYIEQFRSGIKISSIPLRFKTDDFWEFLSDQARDHRSPLFGLSFEPDAKNPNKLKIKDESGKYLMTVGVEKALGKAYQKIIIKLFDDFEREQSDLNIASALASMQTVALAFQDYYIKWQSSHYATFQPQFKVKAKDKKSAPEDLRQMRQKLEADYYRKVGKKPMDVTDEVEEDADEVPKTLKFRTRVRSGADEELVDSKDEVQDADENDDRSLESDHPLRTQQFSAQKRQEFMIQGPLIKHFAKNKKNHHFSASCGTKEQYVLLTTVSMKQYRTAENERLKLRKSTKERISAFEDYRAGIRFEPADGIGDGEVFIPPKGVIKRTYQPEKKKAEILLASPDDRAILIALETNSALKPLTIEFPKIQGKSIDKSQVLQSDVDYILRVFVASKLTYIPVRLNPEYEALLKEKFSDDWDRLNKIKKITDSDLKSLRKRDAESTLDELVERLARSALSPRGNENN